MKLLGYYRDSDGRIFKILNSGICVRNQVTLFYAPKDLTKYYTEVDRLFYEIGHLESLKKLSKIEVALYTGEKV